MNYLPPVIEFKKDFLLFTIGKCTEFTIAAEFDKLTRRLTSNHEHTIIWSLLNMFRGRTSRRDYFRNQFELIRFTLGLIHYYPQLLIHQLMTNHDRQKRRRSALLIALFIRELSARTHRPLRYVFQAKTLHSSDFSDQVFACFVKQYQSLRTQPVPLHRIFARWT